MSARVARLLRARAVAAAAAMIAVSTCALGAEAKDAPSLVVQFRGGGLIRNDREYLAHAQTFGYRISGGGGGAFEIGAEILPRFSVMASISGYTATATLGDSKLTVWSQQWLFHLRYAVFRIRPAKAEPGLMFQIEPSIGAGGYQINDKLETQNSATPFTHRGTGWGFRAGVDAGIYYHWVGFVVGWAFHHSPASIRDRIGGSVRAGGHEITAGFGMRF